MKPAVRKNYTIQWLCPDEEGEPYTGTSVVKAYSPEEAIAYLKNMYKQLHTVRVLEGDFAPEQEHLWTPVTESNIIGRDELHELEMEEHTKSSNNIDTAYSPDHDMTFILETQPAGPGCIMQVVGFYFGEPNDEATENFKYKNFMYMEDSLGKED